MVWGLRICGLWVRLGIVQKREGLILRVMAYDLLQRDALDK